MNFAINFCFIIYFSKIFVVNIFFPKFFSTNFVPTYFQHFFLFEGLTLDASLFIETKQTVCICVIKNMIYSKRSKLDFSLV